MPDATLSSKHQLVIPAVVRKQLGLKPGDQLDVQVEGDQAVIRKAPQSYIDALEKVAAPLWKGHARELQRDRDQWDQES